jgi:hypothetical protein
MSAENEKVNVINLQLQYTTPKLKRKYFFGIMDNLYNSWYIYCKEKGQNISLQREYAIT